jgi:hypothetical protein
MVSAQLHGFFDEFEKIALKQSTLQRAYTKSTNLAERYGRQGDKWKHGRRLKDPLRSEKAYKKARRYSRIGQKIKARLEKEPVSLKNRNVLRGERKHFRQIWEARQASTRPSNSRRVVSASSDGRIEPTEMSDFGKWYGEALGRFRAAKKT